jgi:hypothetical protein
MDFEIYIDNAIKEMKKLGYSPNYFIEMRKKYGTKEAIRMLIHNSKVQGGFLKLHELGRPELTMESIILEEQWFDLFSDEDRKVASNKLGR